MTISGGMVPSRVRLSTIDVKGDWQNWKASPPVDVLRPETAYECPDLPSTPSAAGEIDGRAKQMRDPAVLEDNGRTFLFYTICGEQGIAGAELKVEN